MTVALGETRDKTAAFSDGAGVGGIPARARRSSPARVREIPAQARRPGEQRVARAPAARPGAAGKTAKESVRRVGLNGRDVFV
jgi:hypothetical protein